MAKIFIGLGIVLIIIGVVLLYFPNTFSWIGKLSGDIHHRSGNVQVYFPIMSMIIISVVLTIILNLFFK